MRKTGCERIQKTGGCGARNKCINCGKKGTHRVTFQDDWSKVVIALCEECSKKEYENLRLNYTLGFPLRQKKDV